MVSKRILVTGAAGFVGQHLVKVLKAQGYTVMAMIRDNTDDQALRDLGVELVRADLRREETLTTAFASPVDCVVHLATTMKGPWEEYLESTVNGTRRLLDISRRHEVRKFIFLSSIGTYDLSALKKVTITEESPLVPESAATNYEKSKIQAERIVLDYARQGIATMVLKSGVIYGAGGPLFPPRLGFAAGENAYLVIGWGNNRIPLVYIENLVSAIITAIEKDGISGEIFNIVDEQILTQKEYLYAIQSNVNPKLNIILVPYSIAVGFSWLAGILFKVLKRPSPLRGVYLFLCAHQLDYSSQKARQVLGWKPRFEAFQAIRKMVAWFKKQVTNHKIVEIQANLRPITLEDNYNVGIIGCGLIAKTHLDILSRVHNARVAAVCDTNVEAAQKFARDHGNVPVYSSLDEMLEKENLQVVHVLTPPQSRRDIVAKAAAKRCHVFLEKPMAFDAAQAREILNIAQEKKIHVCVGHNHLYDPPMIEARRLVTRGALGDIVYAESWYGFNLSANPTARYMLPGAEDHWAMQLPGKLYQNLISHPISVLMDVMGQADEIKAAAVGGRIVKSMKTDELRVMMKNKKMVGMLSLSLAVNPRYQFLNVYGTEMSIYVDFLNKTLIKHATPKGIPKAISRALMTMSSGQTQITATLRNMFKVATKTFTYYDGTEILVKEFYKRLNYEHPMPVTPQDGVQSMEIMDEIWKQVEV